MQGLRALARQHGLQLAFRDGLGRLRRAPKKSIEAVLAALGVGNAKASLPEALCQARTEVLDPDTLFDPGPGPWRLFLETGEERAGQGTLPRLPIGYHRLRHEGWLIHLLVAPPRLAPPPRGWGLSVPLWGLWQGVQAGLGSYPMLGALAERFAALGAAFVGINPVHAGFPTEPSLISPYTPSDRRFLDARFVATNPDATGAPGLLIDYGCVVPARLAALRASFDAFHRDPDFDAFVAEGGKSLWHFCLHQALGEAFGPYWGRWPEPYQSPETPQAQAFAEQNRKRLLFHAFVQWQAARQLAQAQKAARQAGMPLGLYLDLAVGVHPEGAETWAEPLRYARGVSLGAPPDPWVEEGQRWNLAPLRPDVLMATGLKPLVEIVRAQLRFAGMLRVDHILGFERAFWCPEGLPGLYVRMPREAMLAVLKIEAERAGAVIVGEDLGTVPRGLRAVLARAGLLGCRVALFERDWTKQGHFLPPSAYPELVLASWGTHDLPTFQGWRLGRDLDWRAKLGALVDLVGAKAARAAEVAAWDAAVGPSFADLVRHLAATPARLVALASEDLAGDIEQTNLPGTVHEHPNWRRRLAFSADALSDLPATKTAAALMAQAGRRSCQSESDTKR